MPPYKEHCLALNGPSNLRPLMLAIQATRLLHFTEATMNLDLSRRRNPQNRMPLHSLCSTATLILQLTQAYGAITLTVRPAQRSGLLINHPFSLACLLLAARTNPQGGRRMTKAVISANQQSSVLSNVQRSSRTSAFPFLTTCPMSPEQMLWHASSSAKFNHAALVAHRDGEFKSCRSIQ